MSSYKVVASNVHTAILAVQDASGKIHLGRSLVTPPPSGTPLSGASPVVGLLDLRLEAGGEPLPTALVMLDCEPAVAVQVVCGGRPGPSAS